jgi:hypothetical protein
MNLLCSTGIFKIPWLPHTKHGPTDQPCGTLVNHRAALALDERDAEKAIAALGCLSFVPRLRSRLSIQALNPNLLGDYHSEIPS